MTVLDIAKLYFDLSNNSDFNNMERLFTNSSTYSSPTTGIYLGRDNIIAMQKEFHGKYKALYWKVNSVSEIKPGIVLLDYDFIGEVLDGNKIDTSGLEYVIIYDEKIQHIEIRNKNLVK